MADTQVIEKKEDGTWEITAQPQEATANLEQAGVLAGIDRFEIAGIQVGAGLMGGTLALLTSEVVDGVVKATGFTASLVKLAAAGVLMRFGSGVLGKTATTYAGAFIAFDVARGLIPVDQWISDLTGRFGGAQLKQTRRPDVIVQAEKVAQNYYGDLGG